MPLHPGGLFAILDQAWHSKIALGIRVLTRDSRHELGPGDTYAIPANVEHSIEIVEDAGEV